MRHIKESLPVTTGTHWGRGCASCSYGIVLAPALTRACELHLERLVQAIDKQITFCECQAGTRYRVYLLNRRQALIEEARKDPRMAAQASRLTHPDIEIARQRMASSFEYAPVPTIRFVKPQPTYVEASQEVPA